MLQQDLHTAQISRNLRTTWWITLGGLVFFEVVYILLWMAPEIGSESALFDVFGRAVVALVWLASTLVLMERYRSSFVETRWTDSWVNSRAALWSCLAIALSAVAMALHTSGLWAVGIFPLAQSIVLLRWPQGIRYKLTALITALLIVLVVLDGDRTGGMALADSGQSNVLLIGYSVAIPAFSVLSLWWWDVVVELDSARKAEAELGATRERLRLANDLHDLQGHHLQVLALQLELAERVLAQDVQAGAIRLREARETVSTAQRETRDLAQRMRPVVLRHELENVAVLLRASGAEVDLSIDQSVDSAPSDILGPVIRETTTNVLRHGGGKRAEVSLTKTGTQWIYRICNDTVTPGADLPASDDSAITSSMDGQHLDHAQPVGVTPGAGLRSIRGRIEDAGGTLTVTNFGGLHTVEARLPINKGVSL